VINAFLALPAFVMPGASSTLSWNTTLASNVSINQGLGNQSATSTGSVIVSPSSTTIYTLTATNSNGTSTTQATVTVDGTPPSVPTNLAANVVSTAEVDLSWATSTDNVGVVGYAVYQNGTKIATTSATTYADTGLTADTAYSFLVDAFDAAGNVSALSSSTSATTQSVSSGGGGGNVESGGGGGGGNFDTPIFPPALASSTVLTPQASTSSLTLELQSLRSQLATLLAEANSAPSTGGSSCTTASFSTAASITNPFTRNLYIGMTGAPVKELQSFLIAEDAGPAATKLSSVGPTGRFLTLTKNALIEFQKKACITPASGYFGPITRAYANRLMQ
jgi:hypothetical protein